MNKLLFCRTGKNIFARIVAVLYMIATSYSWIIPFKAGHNLERISILYLPLAVSLITLSLAVKKDSIINKPFLSVSFAVVLTVKILFLVFHSSGLDKENYISDIVFSAIFILGNILCFLARFLNDTKSRTGIMLSIGSLLCAVSKVFHMLVEYQYAGGFYRSLPENTPKFNVGICLEFVFIILLYFSIFILTTNVFVFEKQKETGTPQS